MNLFGVLDISGSALRAERLRAEVTATNMANAETTRGVDGTPYKRQQVLFAQAGQNAFASHLSLENRMGSNTLAQDEKTVAGGVDISDVISQDKAVVQRYDPSHPDADKDGYVGYPDINPLTEMVDLMGAQRAYGLSASAIQAEKGMLSASLEILK